MRRWVLGSLAGLLLAAGCGAERLPGAPPVPQAARDAQAADLGADAGQAEPDAGEPGRDASELDASELDASGPGTDAREPDASAADATASDAAAPDATTAPDATAPDASPADGGASGTTTCANPPIPTPASGACAFTAGASTALLIRADLIAPTGYLENAHLLVDAAGVIACAACDCSAHPQFTSAGRLECPDVLASPGLINAHDHITFGAPGPVPARAERYEHRHDWRTGRNMHTPLAAPSPGGLPAARWTELRHLLAGSTAINGAGAAAGLLRNLDQAGGLEGLTGPAVLHQTFPLGDTSGATRTTDCAYPAVDQPSAISNVDAYTPHVAEGIDAAAQNELRCLSGTGAGRSPMMTPKTAVIHGLGLDADDLGAMATAGASLVWSPRSDLDLYGHTAQVTTARRLGVRLALSTDWAATGSTNLLRELRCAEDYSRRYLDGAFSERELVDMVTARAAEALHFDGRIGSLTAGLRADVALFRGRSYRALLDAEPADVVLVMRSGTALYGDAALVSALGGATGCEPLDVCGRAKRLCVERETGLTLSALGASLTSPYALFSCGAPPGEPSCLPERPGEFSGMSMAGDADGDGVMDAVDRCPAVFDPPRPMDLGVQADADGDGVGDACDRCPLSVACP